MDKRTINKIVKYLRDELNTNGVNVNGIALFCSQLRGTSNEESDLDLIIISDTFKKKDYFERSYLIMKAYKNTFDKFKISIDVLSMTPKEYERSLKLDFYESKLI